jgi:hypothetical protein
MAALVIVNQIVQGGGRSYKIGKNQPFCMNM